jgi:ribosomal protein L11 methyltransferase
MSQTMWREIAFVVGQPALERWSDALIEAGALSVQAEDADADRADEQPIFGEPGSDGVTDPGWQRTRLTALFHREQDHRALLEAAASAAGQPIPLDVTSRMFDDQDWVRRSQAQFDPIPIGTRLLITPSWHHESARRSIDPGGPAQAARIAIVLDPGLAFGTGSHPTTRLCLQWLEQRLAAGQSVLDYGCGSGILAIAAAKLGASRVTGVDIDPQALQSSRANARVNQVEIDLRGGGDPSPQAADVVLANILARPLEVLAPLLQSLVAPGGTLVLAGLLARQIGEVSARYTDIAMQVFGVEDGWACLAGHKA